MTAPSRRWAERRLPLLAPDEPLLWQGAPAWRSVAWRLFRLPWVAAYFVGLTLIDMAITRRAEGTGAPVLHAAVPTLVSGALCVAVLAALAWGIGRTTRYTLTPRRLILQYGVALPATLGIPLHRIASVSARVRDDHTGDICLRLKERGGLTAARLWPHMRPWRFGAPEPMLRDLPGAGQLLPVLCRTLEAAQARALAPETPPAPALRPAPEPALATPA
jgi:hypothetical protein